MNECPQHTHLETKLESIDEKLDLIIERQLEYSNWIAKLEDIINQLQKNMTTIMYSPVFPPPVVEDWKVTCKDC